jgi:outer membrane immunogenic protein
MKKFLLGSIALVALNVGSALAADLARPVYKAPPPPPPPVYSWTGCYVGVNAGGIWSRNNNVDTVGTPISAAATFNAEAAVGARLATNSVAANSNGFIGGGQIGCNYQITNWVVWGVEADLDGVAKRNNTNSLTVVSGVPGFPTETFTSTTTVSKSLDFLGTVRGRIGFLATPSTLVYATGGFAYGGVRSSTSILQTDTGILPGPVAVAYSSTASISQTRLGWTVGAGAESMLWGNWSAKFEYLYYNLGSVTYTLPNLVANAPTFAAPTWVVGAQSTTRFNGSIIRLGLNYKFGPVGPTY